MLGLYVRHTYSIQKKPTMINILIADNHPIVRLGIKEVLNTVPEFQVLGDVSTTTELFNTLEKVNDMLKNYLDCYMPYIIQNKKNNKTLMSYK